MGRDGGPEVVHSASSWPSVELRMRKKKTCGHESLLQSRVTTMKSGMEKHRDVKMVEETKTRWKITVTGSERRAMRRA